MPTPLPWRLKKWNGSAWTNAELRKWNGSAWVTCNMYEWNGTTWVLCTDRTPPTSTYTKDYTPTWTMSYADNGADQRNDGNQTIHNYQGYFDSGWANQCSSWFYGTAIHTDINGAVAYYYAQVYLTNQHWWSGSGGYAKIGTHANSGGSPPSTLNANRTEQISSFFSPSQSQWVNLGTAFCGYADGGSMYGLVLYTSNTSDITLYGYFSPSSTYEQSYEK